MATSLLRLLIICLGTLCAAPAEAFPPYRSTDAGTADPWSLEMRLGLLRLSRRAGEAVYSSPLLRVNFGLPRNVEVIGELEYRPGAGGLVDAAAGAKWVPFTGSVSLGMETLLLLPVPDAPGLGVEGTLVTTFRHPPSGFRVHLNVAGFHDARPSLTENGWKTGVLAELKRGRFRPGLELFARRTGSEPVQVLAGPGIIVALGRSDVRLGFHFGLTRAAPDVVLDLWGSTAVGLR